MAWLGQPDFLVLRRQAVLGEQQRNTVSPSVGVGCTARPQRAKRLSALYLRVIGDSLKTENNSLSDLTVDKSFGYKY